MAAMHDSQPDALTAAKPAARRAQSKAHNRAAILNAARCVFSELGYDAATVRDIIRRTDLASGTFYNYFRSKDEIYEALVEDGARRFRPILAAAAAQAHDFESLIRITLRATFQFIADEHGAADHPDAAAGPARTDTPEMRATFETLRNWAAQGIEAGALAPVEAEYLAAAAMGVTREVGRRMVLRRPPDVDGAVSFCTRLMLEGVRRA